MAFLWNTGLGLAGQRLGHRCAWTSYLFPKQRSFFSASSTTRGWRRHRPNCTSASDVPYIFSRSAQEEKRQRHLAQNKSNANANADADADANADSYSDADARPSIGGYCYLGSNVPATDSGCVEQKKDSSAAGQVFCATLILAPRKLRHHTPTRQTILRSRFNAEAGKPYRIWLRGRADNNYWGNDSVFAQFSGSLNIPGQPAYRIGTTSARRNQPRRLLRLWNSGWGWQDDGWGIGILGPTVFFQNTGNRRYESRHAKTGLLSIRSFFPRYAFLFLSPAYLKTTTRFCKARFSNRTPTPTPTPTNQPPQVAFLQHRHRETVRCL